MHLEQFGQLVRQYRLARGLTLRTFSQQEHFDAAYVSRLENGRMQPPQPGSDTLERLIFALRVPPGEQRAFVDLAALARGEIPPSLSESELVARLPLLCRLSGEQIDRLVELAQTTA